MNDYTKYADPFLGNGEIDLPHPTYPASSWHFIKGLSGNTNPAATLPFGKYSVLGYDGAYPTGNGINRMNCGGSVPKLYDEPRFIGLSHFQHSGTGAIGVYYNYALCSPFVGFRGEEADSRDRALRLLFSRDRARARRGHGQRIRRAAPLQLQV